MRNPDDEESPDDLIDSRNIQSSASEYSDPSRSFGHTLTDKDKGGQD